MADVLVINGPNLNILGQREKNLYGSITLEEIEANLKRIATPLQVECKQSNQEHELVEWLQMAEAKYIIINPAAYTHTSIAIRDTLLAINIPFIEVHLSNLYSRESFRHKSVLADLAQGVIMGLGAGSYYQAMHFVRDALLNT